MHPIWVQTMKRILILTYLIALTTAVAVAQTYGTHHKPGYDPTYQEGFTTNGNNSSNLAPIGATSVPNMATTTYDEITISPTGPLRAFNTPGESGQSGESPIGEPTVLLIFAAAFAGGVTYRKLTVTGK